MARGSINRRQFLNGTIGLAAAGLAASACGGGRSASGATDSFTSGGPPAAATPSAANAGQSSAGGSASGGASSSGGAPNGLTPAYMPFAGVKPDLPAGGHGIPAGFFHYPANPPKFINHSLGASDKITFLLQQGDAPAAPLAHNKWWQSLNAKLKTTLDINDIPGAQYLAKFQTAIAGGDLPDVIMVETIADMPQVLAKDLTDLTDYLGGDNIKAYPGLASIPTATWQIPDLNGKLWGITQPRPSAGDVATARGDLLKDFGLTSASLKLSNGQDFVNLCKELTDVKRTKYALGEQPNSWVLNAILEMMGAPNGWSEQGGKFTSVNEAPQMKPALEVVAAMWKNHYIHPDSFATPGSDVTWWTGGITSILLQGFTGWTSYAKLHPGWDIGIIPAPKWNGGGLADKKLAVAGYGSYSALKKAKASRVKEILNVLDYLAAPFGTSEYLDVNYGVKGVDYTLNGTDPVPTEVGDSDHMYDIQYCGTQGRVNLYVPGDNSLVKAQHAYLSKVLPTGVPDPSWGLYSPTASSKGALAGKNLSDVTAAIIQGRKKVSEYDGALKTWLSAAGNAERSEYEAAYAKAHDGS